MSAINYKYDVTFSFLQEDESLAVQVNDLLQDRLSTFIYTERQREVAGTDGEVEFNKVFETESRIVVVFYRKNWGQTPWTRIEETAIRNRAYEKGYGFVLFIPLDSPPTVPEWLPRIQLWIGLERWGIEGAASVIEARVQEEGGKPKEETVADRAARINREIKKEETRNIFLTSEDGVNAANGEAKQLFSELEQLCCSVGEATDINFEKHKNENDCSLYLFSSGLTLTHCWYNRWSNTLEKSGLYVRIWQGKCGFPHIINIKDPVKLHESIFDFDMIDKSKYGWRKRTNLRRFYTSKELADSNIKLFLDKIRNKRIEGL